MKQIKQLGKFIALSITTLSLFAGCGLATQDAAFKKAPIKVGSPETQCLEKSLDIVAKYFQAKANVEEVEQSWNCFGTSINAFLTQTQGQNTDSYTPNELRTFFELYFLGDLKITDGMLTEIMRLKQILLGGRVDVVSREELNRTFRIINVLKTETIRIQPYIDIIGLNADKKEIQDNPERLELGLAALNIAIGNLVPLFSTASIDYNFSDLEKFMVELKALLLSRKEPGDSWKGPDYVIDHIATVVAVKSFLMVPGPANIARTEWNGLLENAGDLFELFLRTHYLLSDRDLLSGPGLEQLTITLNGLFDVVQNAINAKPNKTIAYKQFNDVIDEAIRVEIVTWKIPASTLHKMCAVFIDKVFTPPVDGVRKTQAGLHQAMLGRAREGLFGWLDMQRVWSEVVRKSVEAQPSLRGQGIPIETVRKYWAATPSRYKSAYEDVSKVLARENPVIISDEGTVVFDRMAPAEYGITQWGFDSLNWKLHFARIVGMGWSADPEANRYTGVTKNEFEAFFNDVRDLAIALRLVEKEDKTIWDSSFDESNMFMLSADGNDRFSFFEGLDFISDAMSSSQMVTLNFKYMEERCEPKGNDDFGRPKFAADCFRGYFQQNFQEYYRFLPTWTDLAQKLGPTGFVKLQRALETAARSTGYSDDPVSLGDINKITMVMHYLEAVYSRFDENESGTITVDEAIKAFPLFKELLKKVPATNGMSDKDLQAVFLYVLHHKREPKTLWDKLYFATFWSKSPSLWKAIKADRVDLLMILGRLKELSRPKP